MAEPKKAAPVKAVKVDDATKKSQARTAAEKRLREAHADEFHGYMEQEYKQVGLTYERRLTPAEKAAAQVAALVAEFGAEIIPVEVYIETEPEAKSA
jgi:hypothetical protein